MFDTPLDCSEGDCLQRASPSGVQSANASLVRGNEENWYAIRCLDAKQDVLLGCEHPICF